MKKTKKHYLICKSNINEKLEFILCKTFNKAKQLRSDYTWIKQEDYLSFQPSLFYGEKLRGKRSSPKGLMIEWKDKRISN